MRPHVFRERTFASSPPRALCSVRGEEGRTASREVGTERGSGHLTGLLLEAMSRRPGHPAVEDEAGRVMTYKELDEAARRLSTRLRRYGVGRGDRVGLMLPKSLEAVASIHGILRTGGAYVPVDASGPPARGAGILADAWVKAVIIAAPLAGQVRQCWPGRGPLPRFILVGDGPGSPWREPGCVRWEEVVSDDAPAPALPDYDPADPAYILYTSGSTGRPKGVTLSHANAFCFLDWCAGAFGREPGERFSSHAPFHFDLSVFDLYACARAAGTLVLVGESLGKDPKHLGDFLADRRIDVWYSAPSILALLTEYGRIDRPGFRAPRLVLFAGEVFPLRPLKKLRAIWPESTMWNLYGPTETNVCTAYKVPRELAEDRADPLPIGPVCPPLRARVVDEEGRDVAAGACGELLIAGPGVMEGYFGRPELSARAFLVDDAGESWYRTGDLVSDSPEGFIFHGRRDRMVKRRGYRIELGEIEAALYKHPSIDRAAVVSTATDEGTVITAFVAPKAGLTCSTLALKRHCAETLPVYMVPDRINVLAALPETSTSKIDYPALKVLVGGRTS